MVQSSFMMASEEIPMMEDLKAEKDLNVEPDEEFEEQFDQDFWKEVDRKYKNGLSFNKAMDEVRAERLMKKHGDDVLLVIIYKWPRMKIYRNNPERIASLEYLIVRLTEIIIAYDGLGDYEEYRYEDIEEEPTLLHLAVLQNFSQVCRCLVEKYPGLIALRTREGRDSKLPVEWALEGRKDDAAAYLISQMIYDRVQSLFLSRDNETPSKFYFGDIINYQDPKTEECGMKKTVKAVLNKLINPRWPYLPDCHKHEEYSDDIQRAISNVPDNPMNYDFYYHVLEADGKGRRPKLMPKDDDDDRESTTKTSNKTTANEKFNCKSVSCLRLIADSKNKEAIQHPVVRMLVARKWNKFGRRWFRLKGLFFLVFLFLLSFALVYGSTRKDPLNYDSRANQFRGFCEIMSIVFLFLHFLDELDEVKREGRTYFMMFDNYLDMAGIFLTFLVVPLRFVEVKWQWSVAAIGYACNVLRLFKFANAFRITGLYTTTLKNILKNDITRFMSVFFVVFFGFCGSLYIALKTDEMQSSFTNFTWLLLAGFRVLVEGDSVVEDYEEFGWLVILLLLVYMGLVVVLLLNVLIAQLSCTYEEAKSCAKLQYTADTMKIIARLEQSCITSFIDNPRAGYYKEQVYITDDDLGDEMLEDNDDQDPWESSADRVARIRDMVLKEIREEKEEDPMDDIRKELFDLKMAMKKN